MSIQWIQTISSNLAWPHVGISYFTHGNEPVGEKIVHFLLHTYQIEKKLLQWSISFIHVNLEASKQKKRYINHNMNRIWEQEFQHNSYEFQRKQGLIPFFETLDIIFDIHSTSKKSPCILITDTQFLEDAKQFASVSEIWIGDMKQQWTLISSCTSVGKAWFGIEAWSHNDPVWYIQWIQNIMNFLSFYGCIKEPIHQVYHASIYMFLEEIFCTDASFEYSREFTWLQPLSYWEIIARENNIPLTNTYKKNSIYFGLATNKPHVGDGAWFFFQRIDT